MAQPTRPRVVLNSDEAEAIRALEFYGAYLKCQQRDKEPYERLANKLKAE